VKIALVCEWLDPWRGGAETSTMQFLHRLMATDVEVHVFTRSRLASTPSMYVHTISGASMSRARRSMTFARRVEKRLAAESFDLVHAISPCRGADIYQPRGGTVAEAIERNLALRRNGTVRRLKRYANHFNVKQRYLLTMERELFSDPHGPIVVAISRYVARQLRHHYGVPHDRIRVIYNGVEPDTTATQERQRHRLAIRKEFDIASTDLLVLAVAHNFRLKGVRRWMEAMALLQSRGLKDLRSLVIGKGDSPAWHRLAARLNITDRLSFVGPSDRVPMFYHAADVLVHPTYYDPCSRVVLEAMIAGLPCISTRWDGAAEVIEQGKNGFVLDDPWNVEALAARIERLRDAALRNKVSQAAGGIAERVSMAAHVRGMMRLYQALARAEVRC